MLLNSVTAMQCCTIEKQCGTNINQKSVSFFELLIKREIAANRIYLDEWYCRTLVLITAGGFVWRLDLLVEIWTELLFRTTLQLQAVRPLH